MSRRHLRRWRCWAKELTHDARRHAPWLCPLPRGGCYVEATSLPSIQWKFHHMSSAAGLAYNLWGYYVERASGIGIEYQEISPALRRAIGSEPLFVINCRASDAQAPGRAGWDGKDGRIRGYDVLTPSSTPTARLADSKGERCGQNGHPGPFNLKYLEIGNENGGPAYAERYPLIARAVKGSISGDPSHHQCLGRLSEGPVDRDRRRALLQQRKFLLRQT